MGIDSFNVSNGTLIADCMWPAAYSSEGHIQSAINVPLETLKESMPKLPKDQKIIVYCRGRLCANSNIATQILNRNGFDAVSLNSSYYYWNKITE